MKVHLRSVQVEEQSVNIKRGEPLRRVSRNNRLEIGKERKNQTAKKQLCCVGGEMRGSASGKRKMYDRRGGMEGKRMRK